MIRRSALRLSVVLTALCCILPFGAEGSVIVGKLAEAKMTMSAMTPRSMNFPTVKAGVIDPTKVVGLCKMQHLSLVCWSQPRPLILAEPKEPASYGRHGRHGRYGWHGLLICPLSILSKIKKNRRVKADLPVFF